MASSSSSSYLSPALQAPDFSPTAYANSLVLATNNASDSPLDLSTPLSRALFDLQEVDSLIDSLTTHNALPLIAHTSRHTECATRVLDTVHHQLDGLNDSYRRLAEEVVARHAAAEQTRCAADRLARTLRLARALQRALALSRRLHALVDEAEPDRASASAASASAASATLLPAARTLLELKRCFDAADGPALARVHAAAAVRQDVVPSAERRLVERCRAAVRDFAVSPLTGASAEGDRARGEMGERVAAAVQTLWLLSPPGRAAEWEPTLLLSALQVYLQNALASSLAALDRSLATLATLDRTLRDLSARCQNIVALQALLHSLRPPDPCPPPPRDPNLLQPLLRHLDTSSLPSYFWRSLAGQLTARVHAILHRGGASARALRASRDRLRDALRDCVDRGYRGSSPALANDAAAWEREAAVMVGSVVGALGR